MAVLNGGCGVGEEEGEGAGGFGGAGCGGDYGCACGGGDAGGYGELGWVLVGCLLGLWWLAGEGLTMSLAVTERVTSLVWVVKTVAAEKWSG